MAVGTTSTQTLQLAAASANNIALSQTPLAAGALNLNGSTVTGGVAVLDVARRALISSGANDAARKFTVTGGNRNGNAISEIVTGVNPTAATVQDFKTVTSITVDAATAGAITVGTNATGSTEWIVLNGYIASWDATFAVQAAVGVTYSVEVTLDDPNAGPNSGLVGMQQFGTAPGCNSPPIAYPAATALTGATGNQIAAQLNPVAACRLTITAGTGLATFQVLQSGLTS